MKGLRDVSKQTDTCNKPEEIKIIKSSQEVSKKSSFNIKCLQSQNIQK